MKRSLSCVLAVLLSMTLTLPAAAISFDWGFVAGMNLSKMKFKGDQKANFGTDNRAGWYIGPKVGFATAIGIGLDASAQYSLRKLNIEGETENFHSIEIPVNLRYNIGLGKKAGVYVATGPQFGFGLGNLKWDNIFTSENNEEPAVFSKQNMNLTWNIGAGLRLLNHLEIGIGYNFALGKVGEAVWTEIGPNGESQDYRLKYRTNTFQVQLAYIF